ncbi:hypothetical protein MSIBF_A850001 [groundwater metagenome]|uniref:50S ribosomal protein L11P n=1 Tax=groundwater metagenome TaxID=717931 RepID=A0A098EEN9_9ZZZZ
MLGPTGVNIKQVIDEVNKKTKDFEGMKVPVKITIDTTTKKFEIEVGTPPTSALLKKEIGLAKGGKDKNFVGDISMEQILKGCKNEERHNACGKFEGGTQRGGRNMRFYGINY